MIPSTCPAKYVVCFAALVMSAFTLFFSAPVYGQVAGATLTGTVKDTSGGIVPNAQITITDVATEVTRTVSSGSAGLYTAPNLLPGTYQVRVAAPGFTTALEKGITLTVGAQQVLDITMQVGQMTQSIEVTTEAPTVELASSSIDAVVTSNTVRELPLNGRSWTDLATLQPGISVITTQPAQSENRGYGAQLAISGARPQQNNYRLDGVSLNDYSNGGPGSVLGGNLGVDAIQEFSVLTSNYSAEYGKTSGGVVNAVTRAGTNEFHGSVYEFLRNSALDARNVFDSSIPPFRRNQFGASAGGPIQKDHTFVFGDYEGIRQSLGITSLVTVPSPTARSGLLHFPGATADPTLFPPQCTPTGVTDECKVAVDPQIQKVLSIFPLPNGPIISNGDLGSYSVAEQQIVSENFSTIRVDHKFSDKDSLFGTYMFDNTPLTTPDNFNDVLLRAITKRQALVLEESHIFNPALINSIRFGFNRDFANGPQTVKAINPAAADPSLGPVPGYNLGTVLVPGVDKFQGGLNSIGLSLFRWNSFQVYDDVFFTRGLHSLKFGVAVERDQLNEFIINGPGGEVHFGSLSDFLTNQPQLFFAAFPTLLTPRGTRQTIVGLYAQDDWRFRRSLTLNLGLRYEMSTVPTEVQGKLSNLYNLADSSPHLGDPYFLNPTLRNFEPRVGFAWDPFRNGKTAVRGGFGMYDSLPMLYEFATLNGVAAPFFEQASTTTLPQGSFPKGAFSLLSPSSFAYDSIEPNPRRNYVLQWNLNVQSELIPNLTAIIGYVGSRGIHNLFRSGDANIVMPTLTSQGYLWPVPIGSGTVINPNAGDIRYANWGGESNYNGLEFGLTKRMSRGFSLQGSFTWSKSIDTSSSGSIEDNFVNSISSLPWFNLKLNRAVSDFNVGRTVVISGTWQVPDRKSLSGPAAWIANGWELGTIFKANDGAPFSATFGSDGDPQGLNSADPWAFPNRLTGAGCQTLTNPGNPNNYIKTQCFAVPTAPASFFAGPTPMCSSDPRLGANAVGDPSVFQCLNLRGNAGRNILIGPGLTNLDFSVFKNNSVTRISENFKVQFRAELFNILNHPNFATPNTPNNTDIFDSKGNSNGAAGLLTSTTTTSRQIQFALKLIW